MKNFNRLAFVFVLLLTSCKKETPKNDAPKTYPIVSVLQKNLTGYQSFPTNIQGIVNNDVRAKIQGYITQVLVDEGQYVTKGQALFRLETNVLNESADAAQSGISAARATASAAQANVSAAQAGVRAAMVEVDKLRPLVEKKIISAIQLQTAQANLAKAQAQLSQAKASQQQANAGIASAQANYKSVEANIDYSVIRAPISGVIGRLPLRVGSLVGPNDPTPLTTISDTNELYAYFSMNEKDYLDFLQHSYGATLSEKLKNLPLVQLKLANGQIYQEKGRIETVSGQIDEATGSIQFRVKFPNPQKLLSNGNSGNILLPTKYDSALVIPESATYEQQGKIYAYKVQSDSVISTPIEIKDRIENMMVLSAGLEKGNQIVAAGIAGLKTGTKIKPKPINFDSLVQSIKPVF